MYRHLLVPTDGTDLSNETIGQAVKFARSIGARITFVHALHDYASDSEGALLYSMSPAAFSERAAGEGRAIVAKAEAAARAEGVLCEAVVRTSDRPYEVILESAAELGCDLIFMASHGRKGLKGLLIGSQTLKVLASAPIPVLVSTSERNLPSPAMVRAVGVVQDEHRSLAAVLHALNHLAETYEQGTAPNFPLLRAILFYIEQFSGRLHHPKEEDYIFAKLAQRTHEADTLIAQLRQHHVDDRRLQGDLARTLAAYEAAPNSGLADFVASLKRFTDFVWGHMGLEEKVILTTARNHLTDDDWNEIARAFRENADPRFGSLIDKDYRTLFSRILNLVPPPTP